MPDRRPRRNRWVSKSVAGRQRGKVDWTYIERNLTPLVELKEQPEILDKLAELRRLAYQ